MEGIRADLVARLAEAKEQGGLGEVAAIETTMAAAAQKIPAHVRTEVLHSASPRNPQLLPLRFDEPWGIRLVRSR